MTTYYIFRHGNTKNTDRKNLIVKLITKNGGGSMNLPILPKSKPALIQIGKYLKDKNIDAFYTSPYLRCKQSSKIVEKEIGKKFIPNEKIRELRSDIKGFMGFKTRVRNFIKEVNDKNYKAVAVCTHGAVIAALKYLLTRGKFYYFQGVDFPKPGNLIVIEGKKIKVIDFNKS
jgi:broad specificity phosphatase PhoE